MSAAAAAAAASAVVSLSQQSSQPKNPTVSQAPFFLLPYSDNGAFDDFLFSGRFLRRRRDHYRNRASSSSSTDKSTSSPSAVRSEKPQIELEFVDPKPRADGSYARQRVVADSGEKLLRNIMIDNKIELYAAYGKVMNCGGGGSCGTCIVEIIDGQDLLNERTNTENQYLKKKPKSWRLACQTIVGNKENAGKVTVQRLPQWKK